MTLSAFFVLENNIKRFRVSVSPSAHAWIVTKPNNALRIVWYHTKRQSLCYSDTDCGW